MSLRSRLVVTVAALLAVGLVTAALASLGALRFALVARTDAQLDQLDRVITTTLSSTTNDAEVHAATAAQPLVVVQLRGPDGSTLRDLSSPSLRSLRVDAAPTTRTTENPDGAVHESIRMRDVSPTRWRVRVAWSPDGKDVVLLGLPMTEFQQTFLRLFRSETVITLVVLALIVLVAWRVVRVGLRPLDDIAEVATAIGRGDLDRRVPARPPGTEIGRLSTALNAMLMQIQTAFRERLASEERLRRFVADASHELNTPIATIRGYAELFRHGAADNREELATAMRRIESEATRTGQLVDELLTLAQLDADRPLHSDPVNLGHLATEAAADARALEPDRRIDVHVAGDVVVRGDEARLRQVLTNLLANVRTHTPPGTPARICVTTDATHAVVEVGDDGPGIPSEHVDRVFERFYRPTSRRSRSGDGSGLGLAIVASIAAAHGGDARARSAPGSGTTVTIRLPRTE